MEQPFYCGVCECTHSRIEPRSICPSCGRVFCLKSLQDVIDAGMTVCPFCSESLLKFPYLSKKIPDFSKKGRSFVEFYPEETHLERIEPEHQEILENKKLLSKKVPSNVKISEKKDLDGSIVLPKQRKPMIEVTKSYIPLVIPSYRRTEVISEQVIKSVGNTDVMYLQLKETVPLGFELPTQDQVEILKGDQQFENFGFKDSDGTLVITLEHLEESEIGALSENDELTVKYPLYATGKPDEEYTGKLIASANIYPEVKPITKEAEAGPIIVVHERRKLKIGKSVSGSGNMDEYDIILRGINDGAAVIPSVEITDFLPQGFELVGKTFSDPAVGFEQHSSANSGRVMKWIFENVHPQQKVEIRFKIKAPADNDPQEVYKMLVG